MSVSKVKYWIVWLAVLIGLMMLGGCASNTKPEIQYIYKDSGAEALKQLPDIDSLEPLDLSPYKKIEWNIIRDEQPLFALSYEDYKKLNDLLLLLRGRITLIKTRQQLWENIVNESLDRQNKLAKDKQSSGKVQMEKE